MAKNNGKDDLEAVRVLVDALTPFDNTERERIIRWACEKLGVSYDAVAPQSTVTKTKSLVAAVDGAVPDIGQRRPSRDIKSFIDEKNPQSDRQLAAVVAYYYAFEAPEGQRKSSIGSNDLVDACRLANRHRPKNSGQTLINTAHSGFLDKAEETGKYKLNAVGENLVAMTLPSGTLLKRTPRKIKQVSKKIKKVMPNKRKGNG